MLGAWIPAALTSVLGSYMLPAAAFLGAWISTILLYRVSTRAGRTSVATMLLAGIAQAAAEAGYAGAEGWQTRRARVLAEGWAEIGHIDLLAVPPGDGRRA